MTQGVASSSRHLIPTRISASESMGTVTPSNAVIQACTMKEVRWSFAQCNTRRKDQCWKFNQEKSVSPKSQSMWLLQRSSELSFRRQKRTKGGMKYACVTKHEQDSAQQLTTETESPGHCPCRQYCLEESLVPDWPGKCPFRSQAPHQAGLTASLQKGLRISISNMIYNKTVLPLKASNFNFMYKLGI